MELSTGKKYFFMGTTPPKACFIASITTQAGGVSGDKNMFLTIEFTDGGADGVADCRTFPIGLAERYLREVHRPVRMRDIDIEETFGEEDEQPTV